ncbi:MAG: hypothetical protein JWM99_3037 [Verrucomicrobiales bacterium]|jgi:hypothetical protein|nr:hypothetical protein [Verrucomicrobiales bacterium]
MSTPIAESPSDIWMRAIKPESGDLSPEAARFFLSVKLSNVDLLRLKELSAKSRIGSINKDESQELDRYLEFGWFFDILKSKARLSLQSLAKE